MGFWAFLTEPSPALKSPHHRRQSRLMASVLLVIVPAFVLLMPVAALTRPQGLDLLDIVFGVSLLAAGVVAWGLTRTEKYQRGSMVITATAVVAAALIAVREPDPVRAVFSVLLSVTGPLYASFLLSVRATIIAAVVAMFGVVLSLSLNPNVPASAAVLPVFFATTVLGLTVVSAIVRARHVTELEAAATLLRSTLDASQDAAIIIGTDGKVSEWSLVAARLLGVGQLDALGKELLALVHPAEGESATFEAQATPRRIEFTATRLDGATFPCEGLLATLPDGRTAVFLRDVTERKQMEARLMMSDRLETMGRMVAGVAHEINNPLAYVTANLNFLTGVIDDVPLPVDEMREVVKETVEGARRIQAIVQDLRIFSRSGEFEAVTPVDVETVLDSVVGIASHHLKEAKATLRRDYAKVGSAYGIESRLGQVFLNLVVNAAQALGDAPRREIVVSTFREDGRIVISVRDFGPGIPESVRQKLFTPFFTTKPAGQGTGLGLYISQSIISGLKGELRLKPVDVGTCFEVVLPAAT